MSIFKEEFDLRYPCCFTCVSCQFFPSARAKLRFRNNLRLTLEHELDPEKAALIAFWRKPQPLRHNF